MSCFGRISIQLPKRTPFQFVLIHIFYKLCAMKNPLSAYVEFLLFQNGCVTLPKLGGFILNKEGKQDEVVSIFTRHFVTFNQALKHDDGLLIDAIQKAESVTRGVAVQKMEQAIREIERVLLKGESIGFGILGQMSLDENGHKIFLPNRDIQHPSDYGLKDIRLTRLAEQEKIGVLTRRYSKLKYFSAGVAAACIGVLLLVGPAQRISNNDNAVLKQQANFIESISSTLTNNATQGEGLLTAANENTFSTEAEASKNEEVPATNKALQTIRSTSYYIVIGGDTDKSRANRLCDKFKNSDFPTVEIIESPDRYRIYVKSFADKKEAESFLIQFRKENPKYETAWLFSKKAKVS